MRTPCPGLLCLSLVALTINVAVGDGRALAPVSFENDIKPLLTEKCVHCHNRKTLPDLFSFESAKRAFVTLKSGQEVIVPGEPEKSLLIIALNSPHGHEKAMPMVGPRPTEDDIELLTRWIEEGAEWPTGQAGRIRPPFLATE